MNHGQRGSIPTPPPPLLPPPKKTKTRNKLSHNQKKHFLILELFQYQSKNYNIGNIYVI